MREIERRESENGGEMLRVRERDREIGRERIREWEIRRGRGKSNRSKVRYPVGGAGSSPAEPKPTIGRTQGFESTTR